LRHFAGAFHRGVRVLTRGSGPLPPRPPARQPRGVAHRRVARRRSAVLPTPHQRSLRGGGRAGITTGHGSARRWPDAARARRCPGWAPDGVHPCILVPSPDRCRHGMAAPDDFWRWFCANERQLKDRGHPRREALADELLERLQQVSEQLWFELGLMKDGSGHLIVTAEGNTGAFADVVALVDAAPAIE